MSVSKLVVTTDARPSRSLESLNTVQWCARSASAGAWRARQTTSVNFIRIDEAAAQRAERLLEASLVVGHALGRRLLLAQRLEAPVHESGEAGQLRGADARAAEEHPVAIRQRPYEFGWEGRPFLGEAQLHGEHRTLVGRRTPAERTCSRRPPAATLAPRVLGQRTDDKLWSAAADRSRSARSTDTMHANPTCRRRP